MYMNMYCCEWEWEEVKQAWEAFLCYPKDLLEMNSFRSHFKYLKSMSKSMSNVSAYVVKYLNPEDLKNLARTMYIPSL